MSEGAANKDPVCGKIVDPLRARAVGIFGGVTHYFCSPECKVRFADPRNAEPGAALDGAERRLNERGDQSAEWFEKGRAAPPRAPIERFTDLDARDAPMKQIPPSPSLLVEVQASKRKSPLPWVLLAIAATMAAIWFFGLRR